MTFEQAYNKLEEIVNEIQSWNIPVEDLINKIKEAKKLIEFCEKTLKKVENQINDIDLISE